MEIFIILLLTLINGIFSMSEIALVSSRKFKLEYMAKKGNRGATKALELAETPNTFLSTVQIGITLIGILLGIYSGENITQDVQQAIEKIAFLRPYASSVSVGLVLIGITYLSIVLGELFPKRIGLTFPETIASMVARPMAVVSTFTAPFVWLLTKTNDLLLRLLGIRSNMGGIITEEEIKSIIQDSTESGEIQEVEQDIVERVFAMGDRKVGALMTHRSDLVWFDMHDDLETIRQKAASAMHSVYPVADGDLDDIKGIAFVRELFMHRDQPFQLETYLRQPLYVPITTSAFMLLERFKQQKIHYALILDEYGSLQGMVTMDDILDALVGDTSQAAHEEYQIVKQDENTWIADGQFPFFEFVRFFEMEDVQDDNPEFNTIGGFLIQHLNRLPVVGDRVGWQGFTFEITQMNRLRIVKISIKKS